MPDYLELYGLNFTGSSQLTFPVANPELARLVQRVALTGEPLIREISGKKVYNDDGLILSTAQTFQAMLQAADYPICCQSLNNAYETFLNSRLDYFKARYEQALGGKKPIFPFNLFNKPDKDFLLLLQQHIADLEKAKEGTGYHAITAELKLLASYARYGESYFSPYPTPATDPGTTNRAALAPDQNLVMYVSGYMSDWQGAIREAFASAYKLGYNLEDIYVFTYNTGGPGPIRLSEVYGPDAQIVGDAKVLIETQNRLKSAGLSHAEKTELGQLIEELLNKNDQRLRFWTYSQDASLGSPLADEALNLVGQLHSLLQAEREQSQKEEPDPRRINLIATSQGGAVAGAFLLQRNPATGDYFLDEELNQFLDKYALNVPAHGGAYLAEARYISSKTGILVGTLKLLANTLGLLFPQLDLVTLGKRVLNARATDDLAISSPFTQANYEALSEANQGQTAQHLHNHKGIEIYAANDDVTTSAPLLRLPSTVEIRMRRGRHEEMIAGNGSEAVAVINKHLYQNFLDSDRRLPDLESDMLIYCGYIKKGLPDYNVLPQGVKLPAAFSPLIPFLTGKAGVVDYAVMKKVYTDLGENLPLKSESDRPPALFKIFNP